MPDNRRTQRINEQVKKEMSALLRELKDPRVSEMASVVAAEVTKDMRHAKIYVSVLGDEQMKKDTLQGLNSAEPFLRREIGARVGLRNTPQLTFRIDTTIEYGAHINKIINDLNCDTNSTEQHADAEEQADE